MADKESTEKIDEAKQGLRGNLQELKNLRNELSFRGDADPLQLKILDSVIGAVGWVSVLIRFYETDEEPEE